MTNLNARVIAAHASGDQAALVTLYTQAADATDDVDTACFYLTHAYIFALELGHADVPTLHARLAHHSRV